MNLRRLLVGLSVLAVPAGLAVAIASPPDRVQGGFVRIMYVHVPSAWLAFLAFGVTSLASIIWLVRRTPRWDRLAASSVEVGVLFTGIALLTGMIWGRPVWGVWWDWLDARLMSTAIMFFVYLGYLALRRASPGPEERARRSAALGVVAFIQVPIVYFSVNLFRTLHQTQSIRPGGATMDEAMVVALLVNLGVFTVLYLTLLLWRIDLARLEERAEAETAAGAVAGSAVAPPNLEEPVHG